MENFFLSRNNPLQHDSAPLTGVGSSCKALMDEKEYNILLKLEWLLQVDKSTSSYSNLNLLRMLGLMTSLCTTFPSFNIILILLYFILISFNLSFSGNFIEEAHLCSLAWKKSKNQMSNLHYHMGSKAWFNSG